MKAMKLSDMKTNDELIAEQLHTDPAFRAEWERTALARAVAVAIVRYRAEHDLSQRELADLQLVMRARNGDQRALDELIRRYSGFVRLKASSYFLAGGDAEDLIQEGLARELVHRVQRLRKEAEYEYTTRIELSVQGAAEVVAAVSAFLKCLSAIPSSCISDLTCCNSPRTRRPSGIPFE